ncbi:prepilin-type cleavage/methylation domain-containing protein [Mastigocladus laminosus UU774]|nr:prepilin-type cleavage/methylation domain-containing protein [Mastigocladus laminosus UU774]
MKSLKWLLINQLKLFKIRQKTSGFTLIELLVGLLLAFLVITPLLGFILNIMDNDRKEQAKATTEQDIKAALDYISRDLQQSVYIYDADGIKEIRDELPHYDQKDKYFPVLVFWKRQYISEGLTAKTTTTDNGNGTTTTTTEKDDTFVYSLVAYYLIKDNNSTWSNAARIGRFQISNGYGLTDTEKNNTRDAGFQMFSLDNEGSLKTKMNKWTKKTGENYQQQVLPLVDYIDQTLIDTTGTPKPKNPEPACANGQLVPKFSGSGDDVATDNVKTRGFYVCVDSGKNVAEVYLRGNTLARIQTNNLNFNDNQNSIKVYFPQSSIRVQGLGYLVTK